MYKNIVLKRLNDGSATENILQHGFTDITPDVDFYDDNKYFEKDGILYEFAGWNIHKKMFASINMKIVGNIE
jgi:hypothetical protein